MSKKFPLIPTLLVLIAVAVMIRLGFWQLSRMHEKEALLARYQQVQGSTGDVTMAADPAARELQYFRHTAFRCNAAGTTQPTAGHDRQGRTGWSHWALCPAADGRPVVMVNIGWSAEPRPVSFAPFDAVGVIAPDAQDLPRVIADTPLAGLAASAQPDPADIPNNHWSYAIQWFLFAATALVIYALALRKRLAAPPSGS